MRFSRKWHPDVSEDGAVIYRPRLRGWLRLKDGRLGAYRFLVDSGADISLAPRQLARDIGLPWQQGKRVVLTGISQRTVCRVLGRVFEVDILIDGLDAPITIPVCFASVDAPLLLGREGLFDRLRVEFDKRNRRTTFVLNP